MRHLALALVACACLAAAAGAQPAGMPMPADHDTMAGAMAQAMEKMNRDMAAAPMTGDPDRDFTAMMIPHHQGAIDMARLYLRDGRDPAIRRLARGVVADQEREIAFMRAWQAAHPAK